jgi:hypothetical protein
MMLTAQTAPVASDSSPQNTPPSCVLGTSGVEAINIKGKPSYSSLKPEIHLDNTYKFTYVAQKTHCTSTTDTNYNCLWI